MLEEIMRILLYLGAAVPFLFALVLALIANSAIQQIQAYILFLIAAVCLSGAGIVEAVNALRKDVLAQQVPRTQSEPRSD
jgi:4-hydroxybenzoate polyprenyltransferase